MMMRMLLMMKIMTEVIMMIVLRRECFDQWQSNVLAYLKSSGRARSWSEKQRLQNLWTKRGYDLAYKVWEGGEPTLHCNYPLH